MDVEIKNDNINTKEENINVPDTENLKENNKDKENIENKVKEIIEKNPMEELKLIQEKIRKENEKIDEIDLKLDRIKNNKKTIKRDFNLNDQLFNSLTIKKQNNATSLKLKPILTEKNENTNKSLNENVISNNYDYVHQKMKELKSMDLVNLKNESKLSLPIKKENKILETKNDIRREIDKLIEIEKEEKKKLYENKVKLFHDKELEREKKRKKIIEQMNNIPTMQKNKYNPKKYYYLSAIEKEEIRKQKEEMLLKIEKEKRKQKYLPISSEELNNFSKEVTKNKKILETELDLKKKQMEEIWKERKNLIPKYHSKFMDLNIEYDKEAKEELLLKEEMLLKIEKEKRKLKYLPISSEELNNFSKEVTKNKKLLETELDLKKQKMEEIWKERKNLIPKYHSKFMDLNMEYDKEAKEELILRKERLKNKELERINFGKEIIKNYLPKKLNDKLKTEREQRIKELNGRNRLNNIKELGNKLKEKSKKLILSQPKKFMKKNAFVVEPSIKEQQKKKLTGKPIDYLLEQRIKNNKINDLELIQSKSAIKMKEWNKMLDDKGGNIVNNLEKIKLEASLMNNKANDINQLLKLESNDSPKQNELKIEATNYYINSIQAKLQVLNKIMTS